MLRRPGNWLLLVTTGLIRRYDTARTVTLPSNISDQYSNLQRRATGLDSDAAVLGKPPQGRQYEEAGWMGYAVEDPVDRSTAAGHPLCHDSASRQW